MGPESSRRHHPSSHGPLCSELGCPSFPPREASSAAVSGQVATAGMFALDSLQLAEWAFHSDNTGASHCLYCFRLVKPLGPFDL